MLTREELEQQLEDATEANKAILGEYCKVSLGNLRLRLDRLEDDGRRRDVELAAEKHRLEGLIEKQKDAVYRIVDQIESLKTKAVEIETAVAKARVAFKDLKNGESNT